MSNHEKLQEAISKLGPYVGEIGQHAFMARLLDVAAASDEVAGSPGTTIEEFDAAGEAGWVQTDEAAAPFAALMSGLLGLTDGGTLMSGEKGFIETVYTFTQGSEETTSGIVDKITADTGRLFTITHGTDHADENYVNDINVGQIVGDETFKHRKPFLNIRPTSL